MVGDNTVGKYESNCRAGDEKSRLFAGLELFVNAGDSNEEFARLRARHRHFGRSAHVGRLAKAA